MHVFFTCDIILGCQNRAHLSQVIQRNIMLAESCSKIIFSLLACLQQEQINQMAMVLWGIWKGQNEKLWNNIQFSDQSMVRTSDEFYRIQKNDNSKGSKPIAGNIINQNMQWKKLAMGLSKCNVDASFFEYQNKTGAGMTKDVLWWPEQHGRSHVCKSMKEKLGASWKL